MAGFAEVLLKDCADYDHCLVFPSNSSQDFTDYGKMVMENIQALGYETYIFKVEGKRRVRYLDFFWGSNIDEEDSSLDTGETIICSSEYPIQNNEHSLTPDSSSPSSSFYSKIRKEPKSELNLSNRKSQECLIYVLLRTPLHKLREFAERMELKLPIDPTKAKELLAEGDPEHNIKRVVLKNDPEISNLSPYDCIYARYKKNREFLYWKGDERYRHQDDFISTDNISRYYSKNHAPVFENYPSIPFYTNKSATDAEVNSDDDESINDNSNVYHVGYSSNSISTYNTPANYSRNHSNSAILRNHPFRDLLRIKISNFMLQSRPRIIKQNYVFFTMENLKIQKLLKKNRLLGCYYVLHNPVKTLFQTQWARYPFHPQPIYDIKEYFGEQLAFYYAFLDHYTISLFIPVVIAIPLQISVFIYNDYSAPFIPIYSILLPLWASYMSENWKKKEKFYALQWGMIGYNETEQFRPEFSGEERESSIDGTKQNYFSNRLRSRRIMSSMLVIFSLMFIVVGTVLGIYVLRYTMIPSSGGSVAQLCASIINAIIIHCLNKVYFSFSFELTEWENHRTQTEFENTMIQKLFILQSLNSYASLFYLAFIADYIGDCPDDVGCMPALAWNLGTIIVVRFILQHVFANILFPTYLYEQRLKDYVRRMCNDRNHFMSANFNSETTLVPPSPPTTFFGGVAAAAAAKAAAEAAAKAAAEAAAKHTSYSSNSSSSTSIDSPISMTNSDGSNLNYITSIERDFVKNRLEIQKYELQNFADVIVQYGYNSLFVSALPLTSFFTLLTNIFQIRYESQLLFHCYQRPHPRSAENIGAWQAIMEIISSMSVITNGALIIFSMKILKGYDFNIQLWAFILFQWVNWILQIIVKKYFVPHHQEAITIQLKRQKFIISKLIYQESDDTQGWEPYHGYNPEIFRPIPQW